MDALLMIVAVVGFIAAAVDARLYARERGRREAAAKQADELRSVLRSTLDRERKASAEAKEWMEAHTEEHAENLVLRRQLAELQEAFQRTRAANRECKRKKGCPK